MTTPPVHIIGAGIGGLTAAAYLAQAHIPVVIHESTGRIGGRARTATVDGFAFNLGPHALYQGGEASAVLADLGIKPTGGRPQTKGIVVRDGKTYVGPMGATSMLRSKVFGPRDKAAFAAVMTRIPRLRPRDFAAVTVDDWLDQVAPRPRVRQALAALIRLSTYVNQPGALSSEVAIGQLHLALGPGVLYLDHGWCQLVDSLAHSAQVEVRYSEPQAELPDAAAVIVAGGGPAVLARLTGHEPDVGPPALVSSLDLGLRGEPPTTLALGLDVAMYASKHSIAAAHAPAGMSTLSAAEYLPADGEPSRDRLADFTRTIGVDPHTIVAERYLHRMVAVDAIATAERGGLAGRPGVAVPGFDHVFAVGDWVGPTGHLADAVFASARDAAQAAARVVSQAMTR